MLQKETKSYRISLPMPPHSTTKAPKPLTAHHVCVALERGCKLLVCTVSEAMKVVGVNPTPPSQEPIYRPGYRLSRLTRDSVPFEWNGRAQETYETLKATLVSPPVLAMPDFSKPFTVE